MAESPVAFLFPLWSILMHVASMCLMCKFTLKPIKMLVFSFKREKKHLCKKCLLSKTRFKSINIMCYNKTFAVSGAVFCRYSPLIFFNIERLRRMGKVIVSVPTLFRSRWGGVYSIYSLVRSRWGGVPILVGGGGNPKVPPHLDLAKVGTLSHGR